MSCCTHANILCFAQLTKFSFFKHHRGNECLFYFVFMIPWHCTRFVSWMAFLLFDINMALEYDLAKQEHTNM